MSKFGDDLIQALNEALAHAKGDGAAIVQSPIAREEGFVRDQSEINFQVKAKRGEQIQTNELSWEETYRAMAAEKEDWNDFDTTVGDGLDQ